MSDEPLEIELTILPDPSASEPPPPSRRKLQVGSRRRVALALAVVAAVGAAGFVLVRDRGPDPDDVLRDAQAAVAEVRSFEFRIEASEIQSVGGENIGSEVTERFVAKGKWSDERWWSKSTTNAVVAELLVDGDTTYSRSVDLAGGSIRERPWTTADTESPGSENLIDSLAETGTADTTRISADNVVTVTDAGGNDEERVRAASDAYLGLRAGGPSTRRQSLSRWGYDRNPRGLLDVVENMRPTGVTEGQHGSVVLTGRLRTTERYDAAFGAPLPPARVVLHLDADRVPTRLQFAVGLGRSGYNVDAELLDWSEPVVIETPAPADVDQTPTVDEEHLVAVSESIDLVWPTVIPPGWEMSRLAVESPEPVDAFGTQIVNRLCDTVVMEWMEPLPEGADVEETAGLLSIELAPLNCALAGDATPFEVHPVLGVPMRQGPFRGFELQIGDTVVRVHPWAIDGSALEAAVRSFGRVDLDTVLAAAVAAAAD